MSRNNKELYEFSRYRLDVSQRILRRDGERVVRLTDKAFDTLCVLVRRGGELVGKDELMAEVWPGTIVEENNLDQKISVLRQALSNRGNRGEKFIETVRGHGYRFVADVRRIEDEGENGKATAGFQAATEFDEANNRADKTIGNPAGQIKHGKSLAVMMLAALLVAAAGFGYYFWPENRPFLSAGGKRSVAVLPFVIDGEDANAESLSDGITESIINDLSRIEGLRVMSRNSAFRFKNNQTDTRAIASQLGVEVLVTGEMRRLGDRLIINVRLIDPSDNSQIWGNQFVKTYSGIITAQNEIALAVAQNLRLKLTAAQQRELTRNYTENPEAYQLYQRGRFHYFRITEPEIRKGIDFFQQAIDLDPNYALAYAGIADAYRALPIAGNISSKEAFPQAKAAAQQALEIDPNLAEAHTVLGWVAFWYEWDWRAAEGRLKRAIELAPYNAEAHRAYAHLLSNAGRHDEAVAEGRRARELDPLSLIINTLEGQFLFYAGREREAIDRFNKTFELDPNFWVAHNALTRVYIRQKRYAEAIAALNKAIEFAAGNTEPVAQLGYALAKSGNREQAHATLGELNSVAAERFVPAYNFAMIYNGLGEREEALNYLEKSIEEREVQASFVKIDTRWDNLRSDPRFEDLVRQMNFTQ